MSAGRSRRPWVCVGLIVGGMLLGLYHAGGVRPTTPMTVAEADRLFGEGVRAGQTRDEVEAWLAAEGIPPGSSARPGGIGYDVLRRREDVTFRGWWMDCRGSRTVAEWAGLDVDAVHSVIRVKYPDAGRPLVGQIEVTVYLFFGADGRLIRHWSDEFHMSL